MPTGELAISVLGPLSVKFGNVDVTPTAPKPRQVLALLLINMPKVVSVDTLVRELWAENPPRSASTTLQTYVLQLRKSFARGVQKDTSYVAERILVTRHGGYLLNPPLGSFDLHEFERLAAEGREAFHAGDYPRASALLRSALHVWQGPMLVDVQPGEILEAHMVRIEELRLSTLELRIRADLAQGLHHEVVHELTALTALHPLHESFHALLMIALCQSGRRPHALAVYKRIRNTLVSELGIEPSHELQSLHRAALTADPQLNFLPRTLMDTGQPALAS
ncbi:MAG TPA: AfsR/SARP family transcriptional regulator [Micromonospora sp.]